MVVQVSKIVHYDSILKLEGIKTTNETMARLFPSVEAIARLLEQVEIKPKIRYDPLQMGNNLSKRDVATSSWTSMLAAAQLPKRTILPHSH